MIMQALFDAGRMKRCPRCGIVKNVAEFSIRTTGDRIGHLAGRCKVCQVQMNKAAKERDSTIYRRIEWPSKLKRFYGMTPDDYYRLLEAQGGGCAICGSRSPKSRGYKRIKDAMFCVDHSHSTGIVRGLLCTKCNRAVGLIDDNPEVAVAMSIYLNKKKG